MRELFFVFILFSGLTQTTKAQFDYILDIGGGLGAANFLGDIGGTSEKGAQPFINDIQLTMTRVGFTAFGRYQFFDWLGVNAGYASVWVSGRDNLSKNPARYTRNLSFTNHIHEIYARGEFYFLQLNDVGRTGRYRLDFKSFAYIGGAVFFHNPKTEYNGQKVALQPLQTEGIAYGRIQPAIPAGLGIYFTLDRNHRFGFEVGGRYTFTDYIDDVSDTYPEAGWSDDPLAVELSDRTDEVAANDPLFNPGAQASPGGTRGGAAATDYYLMTFLTYSCVIRVKSNFSRSRYNFVTGKVKRRKSRAKF